MPWKIDNALPIGAHTNYISGRNLLDYKVKSIFIFTNIQLKLRNSRGKLWQLWNLKYNWSEKKKLVCKSQCSFNCFKQEFNFRGFANFGYVRNIPAEKTEM